MNKKYILFGIILILNINMLLAIPACSETNTPCGGTCVLTSFSHMFDNYDFVADVDLIGNISGWNTSCITDMSYLFYESNFNQDISNWDTSNVTDMNNMFKGLEGQTFFNSNISGWNTSKVINMSGMFNHANAFEQDLNNLDVSNVVDMSYMFYDCNYNQNKNYNFSNWDTSNVESTMLMFNNAQFFNHDISTWNTSKLKNAKGMFSNAISFNQNISSWDVSSLEDSGYMFEVTPFNQDISTWNTSNLIDMEYMFYQTLNFNQDISNWNLENLIDADYAFDQTAITKENYDKLLNNLATQSLQSDVLLGFGDIKYTSASANSRQLLIDNYNWTITDGGLYVNLPNPINNNNFNILSGAIGLFIGMLLLGICVSVGLYLFYVRKQ